MGPRVRQPHALTDDLVVIRAFGASALPAANTAFGLHRGPPFFTGLGMTFWYVRQPHALTDDLVVIRAFGASALPV